MDRLISEQAVLDVINKHLYAYTLIPQIKAIPSADKWIPVSERLPKPKEYVGDVRRYYLIQNEYGDMMVARWDGQRWEQIYQNGKYIEDEVVAWMPLPSPYKGEQP